MNVENFKKCTKKPTHKLAYYMLPNLKPQGKNIASKHTGLRNMCKAVSPPAAQPLAFTKRDEMGPKGQPVGIHTTDPIEVDQIASRAWGKVYHGNHDDFEKVADDFVDKSGHHIHKGKSGDRNP